MTKNEIRQVMLEQRSSASKCLLNKQNRKIIRQIKADERFQEANTIAIYYPMGNEVNLLPLLKEKKRIAFPKVEKDGIHFYRYHKGLEFMKSKFGVMEPVSKERIDDLIDFMFVPALAISKDFYRIGFGKGYYDQFLALNKPEVAMGVIYDFQEMDQIPVEDHDQKLDGYYKG